jgi:two-component system, NtrC family, nitrogen regulation response regulator NtrX
MKAEILVVDDEPDIRHLLEDILEDEGYAVVTAEDGNSARQAFASGSFDLVLLDIWMPDIDGISLLKEFLQHNARYTNDRHTKIVMMSGHGTIETAVEATRIGATDFLEKPLSTSQLLATIASALKDVTPSPKPHDYVDTQIVGKSAVMEQLVSGVSAFASSVQPILIEGETGVGKGLFARFIHHCHDGEKPDFINVHGVALQRQDVGATLAQRGTVLIRDIDRMSLETQAVLVTALDEHLCQARLIATAHEHLEKRVEENGFLPELYYRLSSVRFVISPLREHAEDVPELLSYMTNVLCLELSYPYRRFSLAAQNYLRHYPWPGNVIELKNLVQKLLHAQKDSEISLEEVEAALAKDTYESSPSYISSLYAMPLKEARDAFERGYLVHHLRENQGNISQTANKAGLERANLYRKLKVLGIDPKQVVG